MIHLHSDIYKKCCKNSQKENIQDMQNIQKNALV